MADAANLESDALLASVPTHEGYKVLGGVVLYQKLGQGGMGAVYRGRHLRLSVEVAVKVMAPPMGMSPTQAEGFIQRFIREAQVAAGISHQNLVRVIDVNSEANVYFLVMDFVDGESAADRLKRKGSLTEAEAVEIAAGAADGLAEAHRAGIVHRDVKPDNIMVDKHGRVKVADLGLAKAFSTGDEDGSKSLGLTLSQQAIGTPFYMSPEQTRSARTVGPQSDVWSLGVSLYQLVAGSVPWRDTDVADLIMKIRGEPLPDLTALRSDASAGLIAILARALDKDPANRYPDCAAMAEALRAHLKSLVHAAETLADPAAGSTKFGLEVSAPPARTLTLIAESALKAGAAPAAPPKPPPAAAPPKPGPAGPTAPTAPVTGGMPPWVLPAALGGALVVVLIIVLVLVLSPDRTQVAPAPPPGQGTETTEATTPAPAPATTHSAEAAQAARKLAVARTLMGEGLYERAKVTLADALALDPDNAEIARALREVKAKIEAEESRASRTEEYKRRRDEGFKLQLAGKLLEAGQAYQRAAAVAPPGNTEAADRAAACLFEYNVAKAREARAATRLTEAVEFYTAALASKVDADAAKSLNAIRGQLEAQQAEAIRAQTAKRLRLKASQVEARRDVAGALTVAEQLQNKHALAAGLAGLERDAAAALARIKKLPAEQAAAEAKKCLARYFGTPSAAELERIAFGAEGGGR